MICISITIIIIVVDIKKTHCVCVFHLYRFFVTFLSYPALSFALLIIQFQFISHSFLKICFLMVPSVLTNLCILLLSHSTCLISYHLSALMSAVSDQHSLALLHYLQPAELLLFALSLYTHLFSQPFCMRRALFCFCGQYI